MKLLVLVIANDDGHYIEMQKLWRIYMNRFANIKSYFIKYKDMNEDVLLEEDTIYIKGSESLIPGCLDKTIKSIEYFLNKDDFDFNYLIRTNLSTVWNFNKIYNLLKSQERIIYTAGLIGTHDDMLFIAGSGMIFSKYICKCIVKNNYLLDYNIIDDVAIGIVLKPLLSNRNLHVNRLEAYEYQYNLESLDKNVSNSFIHFRCKCDNPSNAINLMQHIISLIYE